MNMQAAVLPPHLPGCAPVNPPPLLKAVAKEFLDAKALSAKKGYLASLKYYLSDLIWLYGEVPLSSVTSAMVQQALTIQERPGSSERTVLGGIRMLFIWSRDQGYLPADVLTAAELVRVDLAVNPSPILRPAALQTLLAHAGDTELRLAIVLWSFAGLQHPDLMRLCWENIIPGRSICLDPKPGKRFTVSVVIRPVLEAWLSPFYGSRGRVIRSKDVRRRFRLLARSLGIPCDPQMLCRSFRAYSRALKGDAEPAIAGNGSNTTKLHYALVRVASRAEAEEFFALTPDRVGIADWAAMVAEHPAKSGV
jgi:hypothetical protein